MIEFLFILFALGASVGSFIGAAAFRLPRKILLIGVRSFCIYCGRALRWFEIIPLVSYLALKGRCSKCGERIPPRDFLAELGTGVIFVAMFLTFGPSMPCIEASIFLTLMLLVALIDAEFLIIPDSLIVCGIAMGVTVIALGKPASLPLAVVSGAGSSLILLLVRLGGSRLFKRPAMGMGDVKLASALGLFIGLPGFLFALWLAASLALLCSPLRISAGGVARRGPVISPAQEGGVRACHSERYIPFGAFLAVSSSLVMLFQQQLYEIWLAWLTLLQ